METEKRSIRRPNYKFYIFIGAVAAAIVLILYFALNINTVELVQGEMIYEDTRTVIVVRDEQVFEAENYGKTNLIASEGQRVEEGTPLVEVFKWGYSENVMNDLLEVQTKIVQYQENEILRDVVDTELQNLNEQIIQKAKDINLILNGQLDSDLLTAQKNLNDLMEKKRLYLKDSVKPDSQLEEFYNSEEQLTERVNAWKETISAPRAGVVSFYFDGKEGILNSKNVKNITYKDIADILNGSTTINEEEREGMQPIYRLVNNFKWYLLVHSKAPIIEFANNNTFNIAFEDFLTKQYQGTVVGSVAETNDYIYVIEIAEDIGELLNARRTNAKFYTKFEGLKVPVFAIKEQDGVKGVYTVNGREKTFVPVNIKTIKDNNAIIEPKDAGTVLAANQKIEA